MLRIDKLRLLPRSGMNGDISGGECHVVDLATRLAIDHCQSK